MKYPCVYLMGEGARGEILSIAYAGPGQHQDAGGKVVHMAPHTSSRIVSKSISRGSGRSSYRGLLQVDPGAHHVKSNVECDALLLDEEARTDTYPYIEIEDDHAQIGHEATVSKIGDEQLFYLMSRGLSEDEAATMVVRGFIEPIAKELPLEYAVELNRLIELEMEGSVGVTRSALQGRLLPVRHRTGSTAAAEPSPAHSIARQPENSTEAMSDSTAVAESLGVFTRDQVEMLSTRAGWSRSGCASSAWRRTRPSRRTPMPDHPPGGVALHRHRAALLDWRRSRCAEERRPAARGGRSCPRGCAR